METPTIKALRIIRDNEIETIRDFAHLMWPKSVCWSKVYNIGHGAVRGKGMWLAAGSFLAKLRDRDLIIIFREFRSNRIALCLTRRGIELIQQK